MQQSSLQSIKSLQSLSFKSVHMVCPCSPSTPGLIRRSLSSQSLPSTHSVLQYVSLSASQPGSQGPCLQFSSIISLQLLSILSPQTSGVYQFIFGSPSLQSSPGHGCVYPISQFSLHEPSLSISQPSIQSQGLSSVCSLQSLSHWSSQISPNGRFGKQ